MILPLVSHPLTHYVKIKLHINISHYRLYLNNSFWYIIDKRKQKLQQGEQEDIAGNYFKPKRANELLVRFQDEPGNSEYNDIKISIRLSFAVFMDTNIIFPSNSPTYALIVLFLAFARFREIYTFKILKCKICCYSLSG